MPQKHTTITLPPEARQALAALAQTRGFRSPTNLRQPSISAFLRSIAAGKCIVIGPYAAADHAVILAALQFSLNHLADWQRNLALDTAGVLQSTIGRLRAEADWDDADI